jgi:hypothetical protein
MRVLQRKPDHTGIVLDHGPQDGETFPHGGGSGEGDEDAECLKRAGRAGGGQPATEIARQFHPMNPEEVDYFLTDLQYRDPEQYALVERIRKLIHSVAPQIKEEVKYGGLLFSGRSPFCGLFFYERHLSLEFSRGAELEDRHKVLKGERKLRRHIKIDKVGDLFKKNVREYLTLAYAAVAPRQGKARAARPASGTPD